ncbi:MAG: choice-of-anchor D domain-containing protein [bacterium]
MKRPHSLLLIMLLFVGILFRTVGAQTDSLIVRGGAGDPGSTGNIVSIDLKNSAGVGKMQFTLSYNSALLSVTDVLATGRTGSMGIFDWLESVPGQVTVLIWDLEGDTIGVGTGSIADFIFNVDSGAQYGDVPLTIYEVYVYDTEGTIMPTTPVNGVFVITEPDIDIPVPSHHYGQIVVGETSVWDVTITSVGTKDLVINYITSSSGEFTVESLPYPQTLSPGERLDVSLTFAPATAGPKSSNVYIFSNDPDENVSTVTLSGAGIAPDISVSDTSHDFGSVIGYNTETWGLTLYNLGGTAGLTVSAVTSSHPDFEVLSPTFPRTVPIDGSLDVTVGFTPSQLGPVSGTLTIFSNDPDEGTLPISLLGTGYYPPATLMVVGSEGQEDSRGNVVPIDLENDMAAALIQFKLNYPPSLLTVTDVQATGRISSMSYFNWSESTPGVVDVMIVGISGPIVDPGVGTIVECLFDVDPAAVPGDVPLVLSDVVLADKSGNPIPPQPADGIFTILPAPDIDLSADSLNFGDVLVGDSVNLAVELYNLGSVQLTVDSVTVEPDQFDVQLPLFPQVISAGDSLALTLKFKPITLGFVTGAAIIHSDDPNESQKRVGLSGRGVLPDIEVSPPSIDFGEVWVTDTAATVLSILNTGSADLTVQSIFVTPIQFEVSSDPLPTVVPGGDTLEAMLSFHPTAVGLVNGSVSVQSDDPDEGEVVVGLAGVGIDPEIELSDTSHSFGNVLLGESRDWTFTIRNFGLTDLVVGSVVSDLADFSLIEPAFPDTISPGDSSSVTVRFSPSAVGLRAGNVSVFSNDWDESPTLVSVTGTGVVPDIDLLKTTHDYGDVVVNTSSDWTFKVYNLDVGDLIISAITTNNSDFTVTDPSFPDTVLFGDSLSVIARFRPSKTGPISGILKIMSNDPDESQLSVSVGGNGVVPDIALSATNHYFGLGVLCDTVTWVLRVYNVGTADLAVDTVFADTSDFAALDPAFPQVVAPGDTLGITVGFAPSHLGSIIGELYLVTDDPDEDTTGVSLSGICVAPDIDFSDETHDFGPVVIGYSGEWTLTVSNVGTWSLHIDSAYTSSSHFELISPFFPQTILPGDEVPIVLSFSPQTEGPAAASFTILSDDCDEGMRNVMLIGTGYFVVVELPDTSSVPAQTISVPITVEEVTGLQIYSLEVTVSFDHSLLTAQRASSNGTIAEGWGSPTYSITSGAIDVMMSGVSPLAGHGPLVYITFLVDSTISVGDWTVLRFEEFRFNDGAPAVDTVHGAFHVNRPPSLDPISHKTANEGLLLSFEVTATDPDRDVLTFWAAHLPAGATFDSGSHTFHWTPSFGDTGTYPGIKFYVSDGQFTDSTTATITVEPTVRVMVPDTTRPAGITFSLPIILLDTLRTEDSVFSVDLTLSYDPDVLTALEATILGAFTEGWGITADNVTEGRIDFGLAGSYPLNGTGVLVYINFAVSSQVVPGDSSLLTLSELQFNDGDPAAYPISGVLKIPLYSISGAVRYYMPHSPGVPVDSVLLTAITGGFAYTDISDETGTYRFTDLVGGLGYAVRPSKDGDWRDALAAYDASLVTRSIVGLETLSDHQRIAADVTGNGTVSALDASQILQFVVGITDGFGIGKDWTFLPESRDYPVLDGDYAGQDFIGILYGDVSGNWGETNGVKLNGDCANRVEAPVAKGAPGQIIRVPIILLESEGVLAADIDLTYDPNLITPLSVASTPLTSEYLLEYRVTEGRIQIALAGAEPIEDCGEMVETVCQVSPSARLSDSCPLELFLRLNEMWLPLLTGRFTVASLSPPTYSLSQNYPNPFNPATTIHYALPDARRKRQDARQESFFVFLKIYNLLGQEVKTLVDEEQEPGYYTVTWDGRDSSGREVPSGIYFYRLKAGNYSSTKRMVLLK